MSFRNVQQNSIHNRNTLSVPPGPAGVSAGGGWIRNPSWLTMPAITSANEEVDMLVPIYPNSNFIAFIFNTSAGTYTVDWGDGTSGTFASAATAQKQYDYTTAALDGTNAPVTFQQTANTVTRTSHGYTNGYPISFSSITTTTGITATQIYYVINATTNTFQLAATRGGIALTLTNDGTGIILPYKQAIIKVTPTTGGATLTTVNLQVKNTTTGLQAYVQPVMDLTISAACTSLTIASTQIVPMNILEKCTILRHASTTFASLFYSCYALQSVSINNTTSTNTSLMFNGCSALQTAPLFDTTNVSNMDYMFLSCNSLTSIPLYNTSNNITMVGMFLGCSLLKTIPLLNTINVTTMATTFQNSGLVTIPLINTSNVANMGSMFLNARNLESLPLLNTAKVTNMTNFIRGCPTIISIPLLNTINVTNMSNMFDSTTSLVTVPLINTSNVTNMTNMFNACNSLITIPLLNTANNIYFQQMFSSCGGLQTVPAIDTGKGTVFASMFSGCTSLQTVSSLNLKGQIYLSGSAANYFPSCPSLSSIGSFANLIVSITVANCKLSGPALDVIYTSLGRVDGAVTFQTTPASTVTLASHGYTGGESIIFNVITTTTGISISTTYYVRNVTTNTFQLSATPTGVILTLTNNGTGTRAPATITVSGNWGIATDTPSIATAKGWTVTGS